MIAAIDKCPGGGECHPSRMDAGDFKKSKHALLDRRTAPQMGLSALFLSTPTLRPDFCRRRPMLGHTFPREVKGMVVYGDILFVLNLVLDYGLLMATARIAGCPFVRLRLLAGALFGGLYALLIFVPGLQFLAALPLRLCSGVVMLLMAFGGQRAVFSSAAGVCRGNHGGGGRRTGSEGGGKRHPLRRRGGHRIGLLAVILAGAAGACCFLWAFAARGLCGAGTMPRCFWPWGALHQLPGPGGYGQLADGPIQPPGHCGGLAGGGGAAASGDRPGARGRAVSGQRL